MCVCVHASMCVSVCLQYYYGIVCFQICGLNLNAEVLLYH